MSTGPGVVFNAKKCRGRSSYSMCEFKKELFRLILKCMLDATKKDSEDISFSYMSLTCAEFALISSSSLSTKANNSLCPLFIIIIIFISIHYSVLSLLSFTPYKLQTVIKKYTYNSIKLFNHWM